MHVRPWRTATLVTALIAIATGMGEMRNALIVRAADSIVAVGGEFGTLSEIALALKAGKPVIGLGTWRLARDDGIAVDAFIRVDSPEEAARRALDPGNRG